MTNCDTSGHVSRDLQNRRFIGIKRYNLTSYLPTFSSILGSSYNEIKGKMSKLLLKYSIIRIYPDDFRSIIKIKLSNKTFVIIYC